MKQPKPVKISIPKIGRAKKKRAPRRDLETPIHVAIYDFLKVALLQGSMIHHSPNELGVGLEREHRINLLTKWKSMGMRSGWPDLEALAKQRDGRAVFFVVEVKSENGELSENQIQVRTEFKALGVPYCIARSIQDVIEFLEWEKIDVRVKF